MPGIKPGYRTTEWWATAFASALAGASTLCAGMGWAFDGTKYQALVPIAATIAAGIAAHGYSISRGGLKRELVTALSYVEANWAAGPELPPPPPPPPVSSVGRSDIQVLSSPQSNLEVALSQLTDAA